MIAGSPNRPARHTIGRPLLLSGLLGNKFAGGILLVAIFDFRFARHPEFGPNLVARCERYRPISSTTNVVGSIGLTQFALLLLSFNACARHCRNPATTDSSRRSPTSVASLLQVWRRGSERPLAARNSSRARPEKLWHPGPSSIGAGPERCEN
jgi:hypothetical protein